MVRKVLDRDIDSSKERLLRVLPIGSVLYTIQYRRKNSYIRYIKLYTIDTDRKPVHLCHDISVYLYERYANHKVEGVKVQCEPSELVVYLSEKLYGKGDALKHWAL